MMIDKPNYPCKNKGMAQWLNWIEQPPPKGQVAGSNPAGVAKTIENFNNLTVLKKAG